MNDIWHEFHQLIAPSLFFIAYAKPFIPPTSDEIVKYKTQTYCGEGHPVERKVVLSVKVANLKLTDTQRHKLLLLAGPRYHVDSDELIMSSEKFPQVKQNKKYVGDLLQSLLKEAKVIKRKALIV